MEIRSSFGLVVDFKAEWCQHLLRDHSSVVEVAFPDDPFLFESLSHPGMIFVSELLQISGAAIRVRLSMQDVIIVVECENELEMNKLHTDLVRCINMNDQLFSSVPGL